MLSLMAAAPTSLSNKHATGTAGQRLVIPCMMGSTRRGDQRECTWTQDGRVIEKTSRVTEVDCNLVFSPLLVSDEGSYQCHGHTVQLTVYSEPGEPYISQANEGDTMWVKNGEVVTLDCSSQGAKPAAEIVWHYGEVASKDFSIKEEVKRMENGVTWKTSSTLSFVPIEDQEIICSAHTEVFPQSRNSRSLQLKLLHSPRVNLTASSSNVNEGESVSFVCEANGSPSNMTYSWFINDSELVDQSEDTLTIERVGRELHGAEVTCIARNSVGEGQSTVRMTVSYHPRILEHPQSVVAMDGQIVKMNCLAEGSPKPQYVWVKNSEDGREEVVGVSSTITLTASKKTEGMYKCKVFVSGKLSTSSNAARLSLMRPPAVEMESMVKGTVGQAAVLHCNVTTLSNNTTVLWTRQHSDGRLDSLKEDMTMQRVVTGDAGINIYSDLILDTLTNEDFSAYGCFAQNEAGTDYRMVTLIKEEETNWISLVIAINTLLGLVILAGLLIWHYRKRVVVDQRFPRDRQALPPIYKSQDNMVFDEFLLKDGMKEDYGSMSNEYFENKKNEHKIDLSVVK